MIICWYLAPPEYVQELIKGITEISQLDQSLELEVQLIDQCRFQRTATFSATFVAEQELEVKLLAMR